MRKLITDYTEQIGLLKAQLAGKDTKTEEINTKMQVGHSISIRCTICLMLFFHHSHTILVWSLMSAPFVASNLHVLIVFNVLQLHNFPLLCAIPHLLFFFCYIMHCYTSSLNTLLCPVYSASFSYLHMQTVCSARDQLEADLAKEKSARQDLEGRLKRAEEEAQELNRKVRLFTVDSGRWKRWDRMNEGVRDSTISVVQNHVCVCFFF